MTEVPNRNRVRFVTFTPTAHAELAVRFQEAVSTEWNSVSQEPQRAAPDFRLHLDPARVQRLAKELDRVQRSATAYFRMPETGEERALAELGIATLAAEPFE